MLSLFRENILLHSSNEKTKEVLKKFLKNLCSKKNLFLEKASAERILSVCESELDGFGPLDELLKNDLFEEICVNGLNSPVMVFHRTKGWLETNLFLTDFDYAIDLLNRMARPLGRRITFQSPRLDSSLTDGSRLHATISPVNTRGFELTLRKFKKNPLSIADLISFKTISSEVAAFLWLALFSDYSILIVGNSGSGKTTTLNSLFSFIPLSERIIVVEDTPEINLPHEHLVKLVSSQELGISLSDLVRDTLRMRPDRLVIGEVRSNQDVLALFDSLLSGQGRGSYATFHADSAKEALFRLKSLGARQEELCSIDFVLVQKRLPSKEGEKRRVVELAEVRNGKAFPLYSYNWSRDCLQKNNEFSRIDDLHCCHGMDSSDFEKEFLKRISFLEKLSQQSLSFNDFTKQVSTFK